MRDSDVRNAVRESLARAHAGDGETRIVEEMGIWSGSVRIDVAVINGGLSGYELKSDRDTLARLPLQAELYSRVFDRLTLVVGERHAKKARDIIPEWGGVTIASPNTSGITLSISHLSARNPSLDAQLVAQLLWKDEALAVLAAYGLEKGWRHKRMKEIHRRLAVELPLQDLAALVRTALKARQNWLGQTVTSHFDMAVDADLDPML